ncbi:hypothetical protein [Thiothrix nivea]|uniref:Cytochrome c domain-containing protein n=1 Tax=Thiothrix nivea (strain ATCC 35100 / DSM 5205 / JP2) TaxID=870187 RepID=A0A656HH41_THINJ|nr:hypothetical protein [Thiothrix nivea]EIJ34345.1 hypothetical protein Thini_1764 [Thiothrix nivea DSM 5205]
MKKLIAGLGLTVLAVPAAQAWTGGIEDMRTMRANESGPITRIKRYHVETIPCGQCHGGYARAVRQQRPNHAPQASGWQRSARVTPHMTQQHRQPVRPVRMYAYYVPQRQPVTQASRIHRIVGQAQPMCRYIR